MSHVLPLIRSPYCFFFSLSICRKMDFRGVDLSASRVGIKYSCIIKWVSVICPESSYPDIRSGIWIRIGDWCMERLSRQWLQLWLNLNIIVDFLHAWCQKVGCIIMPHVNKTRQFADLGMVHTVSTWTDGRQIVQRPAVAKTDVVIKVTFYIKEEALLCNCESGECAWTSFLTCLRHCSS